MTTSLVTVERLFPLRALFVPVIVVQRSRCDVCGEGLGRGASARMVLEDELHASRRLRCESCFVSFREPEGPIVSASNDASSTALARQGQGSSGPIAVHRSTPLGRATRTVLRLLTTSWVAWKVVTFSLLDRLRGRPDDAPRMLRRAFEDLGPTYIKLGQLIASSEGLFPERYCQEFQGCLDRVKPFSFAEVVHTLRTELGRDPSEVFSFLDEAPLASASIAQVHAARLLDGTEVVIKVQRPGLHAIIDTDLRVLRGLSIFVELFPEGERAGPRNIVEDFQDNLREELDFKLEADNMDAFNRIMVEHDHPDVAAPIVRHELTSTRVLVMERFFGHRVDDLAKFREKGIDGEAKLLLGMRAWFQCMIFHGFFHGDVHAGNLMSLDDGRIGFLDFGIVGRFTAERRAQVTDYLMAFAMADFRRLADVMVAMGTIDTKVDIGAFADDLREAYEPILSDPSGAAKYADLIPAVLRLSRKHKMRLPREFVLVTKQMLYFDRYAKILAPSVNVFRDPRVVMGLTEDVLGVQIRKATAETNAR